MLVSCCVKEAGKTIQDSIADIREAIDFCRYYAVEAEKIFFEKDLPGPTGEKNIYKFKYNRVDNFKNLVRARNKRLTHIFK